MLKPYCTMVINHRQLFITAETIQTAIDFLKIRHFFDADPNSAEGNSLLEGYYDSKYPEAIYLKSTLNITDEKSYFSGIQSAAYNDYPSAMYLYGAFLDMGDYCNKDELKASEFFERAANFGHAQSAWLYGIQSFYGTHFLKENKEIGLHYITISAERKYKQALIFLSNLYCKGIYVNKDEQRSKNYLSMANDIDSIILE